MFRSHLDDLSIEEAVRQWGLNYTRSHFARLRDRADNVGQEEEAKSWEAKRREAEETFRRMTRRYWATVCALSLVVVLIVAYPLGVYEKPWWSTEKIPALFVFFVVLYGLTVLCLGNLQGIAWWCVTALIVGAIGVVVWQSYLWLRLGVWPGFTVADGVSMVIDSYSVPSVSVEGWLGVSDLVNGAIEWYLERSLGGGLFYLSLPLMLVALFSGRCTAPSDDSPNW